jgi:putative endonuclease
MANALKNKKMFYVYVISSMARNYLYVGLTDNAERRINEHQSGKNKTTKPYKPYKVILIEQFETRVKARMREKYLKSGIGKEFLRTLK